MFYNNFQTVSPSKNVSPKMYRFLSYLGIISGSTTMFLLMVKLWYRVTTGVCRSDKLLEGKTVLITGANRGIGKATALDMARRKAKVILACRNMEKGWSAAEDIQKLTGNPNVTVVELDLGSFKSVRKCAQGIIDTEQRLDILINNAGIVSDQTGRLTEDLIEEHYATNYFGPFLLTMLLVPLLKNSAPSRIVNVSSILHFWGTIDYNDIFGKSKGSLTSTSWGPIGMYSNTKLANILFTRALSKKLEGTGVTVNAVHPGNTETEIANHIPRWMLFFGPLVKFLVVKSLEEGAQTSIYAGVAQELEGVSGKYLADCGQAYSSPASKDTKLMESLWILSEKITGFNPNDKP